METWTSVRRLLNYPNERGQWLSGVGDGELLDSRHILKLQSTGYANDFGSGL